MQEIYKYFLIVRRGNFISSFLNTCSSVLNNDGSVSSSWINKQIKLKMNRRFKMFKKAIETKEADK